MSVKNGLVNVKVFHMRSPRLVITYIKDLGNCVNTQATSSTFLEVLRSTETCDKGWNRKKLTMQWTNASLGQSEFEKKKLAYYNSVHPGRWRSYRALEMGYRSIAS